MKTMIRVFVFSLMFFYIAVAGSSAAETVSDLAVKAGDEAVSGLAVKPGDEAVPELAVKAVEETVPDVIMKMRESSAKIHDMQCLFIKNVVKEGKKIPETRMEFKFMREPEMIYLTFLNRFKGQKCLYVKGENSGKIVVRPSGMLKFMKLKLDPLGKRAMAESLDPMTGMGFDHLIDSIYQWYAASLRDNRFKAEFIRDQALDGGSFHMIKIASDSEEDGYIYLYVDRDSYLPYKLSYKREDSTATYIYKNLVTNINLAGEDFKI